MPPLSLFPIFPCGFRNFFLVRGVFWGFWAERCSVFLGCGIGKCRGYILAGWENVLFEGGFLMARVRMRVLKPRGLPPRGEVPWEKVTGKPALVEAPVEIADVSGLVSALAGKATAAQGALADSAMQPGDPLVLENRTDDPASPVVGQMWIRTDL